MTIEATQTAPETPVIPPLDPAAETPKAPLFTAPIEEVTDPDDIALRDAIAAAKAEETAGDGDKKPDQVTEAASPSTSTETKPEGQPEKPARADTPMIPKVRLDQEIEKANKAAQEAAYWRGRAEATAQPNAGTNGAPATPQQTPEQRIAAVRTEKEALAVDYDAGNLSMKDYEAKRDALDDKVVAIREEAMAAKLKPAAPAQAPAGDLTLKKETDKLEAAHPWLGVFEQVGTESEWGFLKSRAIENLVARGIDPTNGTIGTYELRKEMAALTGELGPALLAAKATEQGIALPGQQTAPATPQQKPPLSDKAKAMQSKLATAAAAPPNLASISGTTGPSTGIPSEAQVEAMTDEDYDKLPETTRKKLLGIM